MLSICLSTSYAATSTVYTKNQLNQSLATAQHKHKAVLVIISAKWCHVCQELERDLQNYPKITTNIQIVIVDLTKNTTEAHEVSNTYNVLGFPTLIFIDKNGKQQGLQTGYNGINDLNQILNKLR